MNLNEHIESVLNVLRNTGHHPDTVFRLGELLCRVKDCQLDSAFAEFHNAAGKLPYVYDSDCGALFLERIGDIEAQPDQKPRFYREARWRASWCAQSATSGGEGLARSQDVERLIEKEKESTTISHTEPRVRGPVD